MPQALYNKGERRAKVKVLLMTYGANIENADQIIDANIEYARDHVWRQFVLNNESDYRTYVTVADGAYLPADFTAYANDARYTSGGIERSFSYIDTQEIAARKTNPYNLATATTPSIYFENQKINTLPASLSAITFGYYPRQAKMFGSGISDTTYDTMPYNSEDLIHQLAFERTLQQLLQEEKAYALAQQQAAEVVQSNQNFYEGLWAIHQQGARSER